MIMAPTTATEISIDHLRDLSSDAAATLAELPGVLSTLSSTDEEHRQWACEALENCGVPELHQLALLTTSLKSSETLIAYWACKLLARLEAASAPAQPQLVELLRCSADQTVREEAAQALRAHQDLSATAREVLQQAAASGGPRLKRIAQAALER